MICKNCGMQVNEFDSNCPNCGTSVDSENFSQDYGSNTYNHPPIKTTGLLVWSIIELICLSPIFGLTALILYFVKLKPAVDSGNINEAIKSKRTIKILLWVGVALGIIPLLLIMMLIAIPNFSGIQDRMEVRADKATAAQIGKAVRIWYTEAMFEPEVDYNTEEVEDGFVKLDDIENIEYYVDNYLTPTSYSDRKGRRVESQDYYVTIINEEERSEAKVVVAIASETDNLNRILGNIDVNDVADYDGSKAGIAYIEP